MIARHCCLFAFLIAPFFAGCSGGSSVGNPTLKVTSQAPVVLLQLKPGMTVELAAVQYDKNGRIESYEARVTSGGADKTIKVKQKASAEGPVDYLAEISGRAIPASTKSDGSSVGFTLKDQGGAVTASVGTVQLDATSELEYDDSGRAHVSKQTLTHDGKSYDIEYSGHTHDKNGRLSGYKAKVLKAG